MKVAKDLKKKFKERKGITLIALVITIIVLLILAGISITMLTGNNSIMKKATDAKDATDIASIKERAELVKLGLQMDEWTKVDSTPLKRNSLISAIHKEFEGSQSTFGKVTTADKQYDILVDNDLNITVVKHQVPKSNSEGEISLATEIKNKYPSAILRVYPSFEETDENIPTYEEYAEYFIETAESEDEIKASIAKNISYLEGKELQWKDIVKEEDVNKSLSEIIGEDYKETLIFRKEIAAVEYMEEYGKEIAITCNNETKTINYISLSNLNKNKNVRVASTKPYRPHNPLLDGYVEFEITQSGEYTISATASDGSKGETTAKVTIITISPTTATIYEEETTTLTATGTSEEIIWQSSNTSVAAIENRVVTGIKAGTAIITATNADGAAISNSCTVTVKEAIKLDGAAVLLNTTAGNDTINIASSNMSTDNANIATVTNEGIVKCGTETGTTIVTVNGEKYKIVSTSKIVHTASSTGTINGTAAYNNPVIPKGYSAIDTQDAKWNLTATTQPNVNKGLVIMDDDGNQFVWVPVPNVIYDNSNVSSLPTDSSTGSKTTGHNYTPMAINVSTATGQSQNGTFNRNGEYKGLLYDWDTTNGSYLKYGSNTTKNYQGTSWKYREPDVLIDVHKGDWSATSGMGFSLIRSLVDGFSGLTNDQIKTKWTNQLQTEYNDMIENVSTYGGFYIGRYESSLINGKTKSISNSTSMNASTSSVNTWYGLYQKQKHYSATSNGETITEGNMIYGSQYDAMLNWMVSEGIDVTSTTPITGAIRNTTRKTGNQVKDKLKNVFDLLGNSGEWVQEAYDLNTRGLRGGGTSSGCPARNLMNSYPYGTSDFISSRLSLYIK